MPQTPPIDPSIFDNPDSVLWLMHCAEGPVPRAAADAIAAFMPREMQPWRLRWNEDFQGIPNRARAAAGRVLGAWPADLTLTATTSSGLITVAQGFPWQAGDEVLIPAGEFPANLWPWKALAHRGVRMREVPLWPGHRAGAQAWSGAPPTAEAAPEERLLEAVGPRTRLIAASWVRFQDGMVLDLASLAAGCADRRIPLVIDGIQGAGTLVPRLDGVAAFATGGHKALLAPQGLGILWTDPVFRQRLVPAGSWLSVEQATDFSRPSTDHHRAWATDGTRLEQGVPNLVGAVALCHSLELIAEVRVETITNHVRALIAHLILRLGDLPSWRAEAARLRALQDAGRLGSIAALHHGGRGADALDSILRNAKQRGIYPSVREGYLRLAFHGWHTTDDVDRVADLLTGGR